MADWYYARDGRHQGPITAAQLRQMAQAGELQPDDLVFKEGGTNWVPASTVQGLFPAGGAAVRPAPAPARAGGEADAFNFESGAPAPAEEQGAIRRPARAPSSGGFFVDLLMFRRMVAPTIIVILFYLASAFAIFGGLISALLVVVNSRETLFGLMFAAVYLISIPIAILVYRLLAELMIVVFRIYETLSEIKRQQEKQGDRR